MRLKPRGERGVRVDRGAKASTSDPGVDTVLPAKRHSPDIPTPVGQARR